MVILKTVKFTIYIIAFFALIIGCGEDTQTPELVPQTMELALVTNKGENTQTSAFVNHTWKFVSLNSEPFEKSFSNRKDADSNGKDADLEQEFTVAVNSVVFSDTGTLTIVLEFHAVEKYATDPLTSMTHLVKYTANSSYTTQDNRLTITETTTEFDVDVSLEPQSVWEGQIEGMTVEELESDLAAEAIKTNEQDIPPLFKDNTEYTWQVAQDKLTITEVLVP